jgi:peptide/nickel transport system substrate-binding protein
MLRQLMRPALVALAVVATVLGGNDLALTQVGGGQPRGLVSVALSDFGQENLDPSQTSTTDLLYSGPQYDWLIGAAPDGTTNRNYGVLRSWEPNADASVWTFTLKNGIKWHDGREVTSDDVKFTLEYFGREKAVCTSCGPLKANVARLETVDRYTTRIQLKKPDVNFPVLFGPLEGDVRILPKHYMDQVGPGFGERPMGSGPWKFVRRNIGQSIEYEANTSYWNRERIPGFANLRIVRVPEATTRTTMLRRGEVDVAILDPPDVKPLQRDGFRIYSAKNVIISTVAFLKSYDPAFFTNKLPYRKALTIGVDWGAIVKSFYPPEVAERHKGGAVPFSPLALGYDPNLPPYPYDPGEARRLLREAGYKGEQVTFWSFAFPTNPEQREMNEVIAGYWRGIGLNVRLVTIDYGSFRPKQVASPQPFDPPIGVAVLTPSSRPSLLNNLRVFMISRNAGGPLNVYWNPDRIDRIYAQLSSIVDRKAREKQLLSLNRELYQEYWAIPIALRHLPYGVGSKVSAWSPTNGTPADLAYETLKPR